MLTQSRRRDNPFQLVEDRDRLGPGGESAAGSGDDDVDWTEAVGEIEDRARCRPIRLRGQQLPQLGKVTRLQQPEDVVFVDAVQFRDQQPGQSHVAEIEPHPADPGQIERSQQQIDGLDIGLDARVPVDLRADLDRLARCLQPVRPGPQHGRAVAEAGHLPPLQKMGVDARDLGRDVGADPQRAAGDLVDQLERLQVQVAATADQQRIEVLDQRRNDEFIAAQAVAVEYRTAQILQRLGLRRQQVRDRLREQPPVHPAKTTNNTPTTTDPRPMNRIWPLRSAAIRRIASRQPAGETSGKSPSMISTMPSASSNGEPTADDSMTGFERKIGLLCPGVP